jgi:hypothetical protein
MEMKGVFMNIQMNKFKWKVVGIGAIAGILFLSASLQAEEGSFTYPIKKHVTGNVMSVTPPLEKGKDGEIIVNERVYRVSPKTVMVDLGERNTGLNYFKIGTSVYMIVDVYKRYNEALFISPSGGKN